MCDRYTSGALGFYTSGQLFLEEYYYTLGVLGKAGLGTPHIVILCLAWGIVSAQGNIGKIVEISPKTLLFLVLSGVSTGLSWICYFRALQIGKASLVAPIDRSSLVLVLIFSAMFLREPLSLKALLGTVFVLLGTLILIL
ncbi:MAG: hypothetical protein C4288_10315 [Leptolyngbya sp. ERB_1_1]